jgi:putative RecB family exonuclease
MKTALAQAPPNNSSVVGLERDYISFSSIRTYQSCPLRYYFKYVEGLPEESVAAALVFGSAIHRAIEYHFQEIMAGNKPPVADSLLAEYEAAWLERDGESIRFGKDETRQSLDQMARRMLEAFAIGDIAKPAGRILAVEETLRGAVIPGLPDLLGRVDLIVETDTALVVTDWKSARSRWSSEQVEESCEQLLLYSELVRGFAPGKAVRLDFAVLTKTKEVAIERHSAAVDPWRVERTKRVVQRVWQAIQTGNFYPAPSPMNCPGCPFQGPCHGWSG